MKATNQSIGRALRHKDDWSSIILLDARYKQKTLQSLLPDWILQRLHTCSSFQDSLHQLKQYDSPTQLMH